MGIVSMLGILAANGDTWSITNLLTGAGKTLQSWGSLLMVVIGVVMVIAGVFQIAKGLISHGGQGGRTNWAVAILLIIVGGAIGLFGASSGWDFVKGVAQGGKQTLTDLAEGKDVGTILLPAKVGIQMLLGI